MSYDNECKITYMDAARQDPVAEIESALAQLRLAQRHGRGPRGGPPFGDGTHGGFGRGSHGHGNPMHGGSEGSGSDGPEPHGMHLRPDPIGRGHRMGAMGGPHGRRLGEALGAARFRMLERLVDGSASISELAEAIGVDQPRASRLVADAAARGFVDRTPDPVDARRMVVALTDAGRDLLASMKDTRRSAVTTALEGFTDEETATFAALLGRFVSAWPSVAARD
jgi:DNA-binding MarR family transcriptional regulator